MGRKKKSGDKTKKQIEKQSAVLSQRDELIRDVKDGMGVEFDDPLLDYVTVQLDRDVFRALSEDPAAPSETED